LIKASKHQSSSIETALYSVRLHTHNGVTLFESAVTPSVGQSLHDTQPDSLQPSLAAALTTIAVDELSLSAHYQSITVDQWAIFPDGFHMLVRLKDSSLDSHTTSSKPRLLTSFVARLKAATAKRINLLRNKPGAPVWQRSYKEQLIEDEITLARSKERMSSAEGIVASSRELRL